MRPNTKIRITASLLMMSASAGLTGCTSMNDFHDPLKAVGLSQPKPASSRRMLEIAKMYEQMGQRENAKVMYSEVIAQSASAEERTLAERKLAALDSPAGKSDKNPEEESSEILLAGKEENDSQVNTKTAQRHKKSAPSRQLAQARSTDTKPEVRRKREPAQVAGREGKSEADPAAITAPASEDAQTMPVANSNDKPGDSGQFAAKWDVQNPRSKDHVSADTPDAAEEEVAELDPAFLAFDEQKLSPKLEERDPLESDAEEAAQWRPTEVTEKTATSPSDSQIKEEVQSQSRSEIQIVEAKSTEIELRDAPSKIEKNLPSEEWGDSGWKKRTTEEEIDSRASDKKSPPAPPLNDPKTKIPARNASPHEYAIENLLQQPGDVLDPQDTRLATLIYRAGNQEYVSDELLGTLYYLMNDGNDIVALISAEALLKHGAVNPTVMNVVRDALTDQDERTRMVGVHVLTTAYPHIPDATLEMMLSKSNQDQSRKVRRLALLLLGGFQNNADRIMPELRKVLETSREAEIREAAELSLNSLAEKQEHSTRISAR